jgi:ABC-type multidrug transport system fused ATPase/permease subunit
VNIYAVASILIMDEATSSVDSETEKEIQTALDNLVQGCTTIAIVQRLSSLHRAHRLVVLDPGHVVEEGSHDGLMAHEGRLPPPPRSAGAQVADPWRPYERSACRHSGG